MSKMENVTYDEMQIGTAASVTKTITKEEIALFARVSGDNNPVHLDEEYAKTTMFKGNISHGFLPASLISTVLGTKLPGAGTIYLKQALKFTKPVFPGDVVTATATVTQKDDAKKFVTLETVVKNQDGVIVVTGEALVIAPTEKIILDAPKMPEVEIK